MEHALSAAVFVLLSSISPWSDSGVSASTFEIGTGIYLVVVAVISSAIGGYLAVSLMNAAGVPFLASVCAAVVIVVLLSFVLERQINSPVGNPFHGSS